jgi:hypothetical protein
MTKWIPYITFLLITLSSATLADERIAWYGNLKDGLEAARSTGTPILLISAAVQCKGVSGIY